MIKQQRDQNNRSFEEKDSQPTLEYLRKSEEKYRSLVKNLNVGVFRNTAGLTGEFLEANPAMVKIFGYDSAEELVNVSVSALYQNPEDKKSFLSEILFNGFVKNKELKLRKKDGSAFWAICSAKAKFNEDGDIEWIDGVMDDITERKSTEEKLLYEAIHDSLTGLFNRRYFMEQLGLAFNSARRYGHPLSFCLCDLDEFKSINDTYGHRTGDEVIAAFGKLMRKELRSQDMGGRYGGDEFCIFFPHVSATEAVIGAERIRNRFQEMVFGEKEGTPFSTSATFGIAELFDHDENEKDMLESADLALYKAKQQGRACVVVINDAERKTS
jgi:diguanylate cyclase (GGDEF)-like protein/PAS domain S-box-containing protein